ncbi:hypothetical protein AB0H73_14995 [Streptomyces olivoreticuli]
MPDLPEVTAWPTRYAVSLLPEDHVDYHLFVITVEDRGNNQWAITRNGSCLGSDGTWDHGIKEYGRGARWLATHRFDLDTALRLAKRAAPSIRVNGIPAYAAAARGADR